VWQHKKKIYHHISMGCPIDSGLISTIDLAMEFGMPSDKM
jgi:hypothetical protein